jgi:hypothetical protein
MSKEMVEHPAHYNQGDMEALEIIKYMVSHMKDPYHGFLVGTIAKYLIRCDHKENATQDLEKARYYMDRLIEIKDI